MVQLLLIVHVLVGAALLGALTHQSVAVGWRPTAPSKSFVGRFRGVNSPTFTNVVCILYAVSVLLGGLLYPRYRIDVRPLLEDMQLRAANGLFETKEHFAAVGLGLLPAYWMFWRQPLSIEMSQSRKYLTWILAFTAWFNFLVGEYLNNIRGIFP